MILKFMQQRCMNFQIIEYFNGYRAYRVNTKPKLDVG